MKNKLALIKEFLSWATFKILYNFITAFFIRSTVRDPLIERKCFDPAGQVGHVKEDFPEMPGTLKHGIQSKLGKANKDNDWDDGWILSWLMRGWGYSWKGIDSAKLQGLYDWLYEEIKHPPDRRWEYHLTPWVRHIQVLIYSYLNPDLREYMRNAGLVRLLDYRLDEPAWTNWLVTGSNISSVNAGKAAWALARTTNAGQWEFTMNRSALSYYRKFLRKSYLWLERGYLNGFNEDGVRAYRVPSEGIHYGLFGLQPAATLSHLQDMYDIQPLVGLSFSYQFANYLQVATANPRRHEMLALGDSYHTVSNPGPLMKLYSIWKSDKLAEAAANISTANIFDHWQRHHKELTGVEMPKCKPSAKEGYCISPEKGEVIYSWKTGLMAVSTGCRFGFHSLHPGPKPGHFVLYEGSKWIVDGPEYVNVFRNIDSYNRRLWNTRPEISLFSIGSITPTYGGPVEAFSFGPSVKIRPHPHLPLIDRKEAFEKASYRLDQLTSPDTPADHHTTGTEEEAPEMARV